MKKLVSLVMVLLLSFASGIFTNAQAFNSEKIFKSKEEAYATLNLTKTLADSSNLEDSEVKAINSLSEKIIEEKIGIKVKATEGILYYDEDQANKSLQLRNDDSSKIIEEKTGVKVKATEGILYYDTTKEKDYKLFEDESNIEIQDISPPTRVNRSYPYESNWSGTRNHSYSRYLFRLDAPETYFSSYAKTPYHAEFHGLDGKYWFTLMGRGSTRYSASIYLFDDLIDYYNADAYYIVMYNDDPYSSAQEAYYSLDR